MLAFPSRGRRRLPAHKEASLRPQLPPRYDPAGKRPSLQLFCLAQILSLKSGSKMYFCMLTLSNGNSARKTVLRTFSSTRHPQASSCQKLAYGWNVITAQNRSPGAQFLTPQIKESRRMCTVWVNSLERPCRSTTPGKPALPRKMICSQLPTLPHYSLEEPGSGGRHRNARRPGNL